ILYIHISVYSARLSAVPTKTIKPFKTFLFFVKKETKKPDLCHLSKGGMLSLPIKNKKDTREISRIFIQQ
ncbi:TPA: hypothetical protein ACS9Q1_002735, partial [Staphylococcus aureus]